MELDEVEPGIGKRISDARKSRGLTQHQLAASIPVSLSLLRKVEQASRDATPGLVTAVARTLGIHITALTGQPYGQGGRHRDRIHTLVPGLRHALAYWDLPPDRQPAAARPWSELRATAERAARLRRAASHTALAEMLPDVLFETTAAIHASSDAGRGRLFELLAVLLFAAHSVASKAGYEDLSAVVEDRITWAAAGSGDPLMGALAAWTRTTSMLNAGAYDIGQRLLAKTRREIDPTGQDDQPRALRMCGPLHLRSAILAARAGQAHTARDHLAQARWLADHLGGTDEDGGWHQLSFGPSNVTIHEVAIHIEHGDGAAATARAGSLPLSAGVPPIRLGRHHVDLSRAHLWAGDRDAALRSLYTARKLAPQQTRHLPTTREVTRMLVRSHRRSNEALARFVAWLGGEL